MNINTLKFFFSIIAVCYAASAFAVDFGCNFDEGITLSNDGKYQEAYELLKPCEDTPDIPGDLYAWLAMYYGYFGYGEFDSKNMRMNKVFELYEKGALKNSKESLLAMVDFYSSGVSEIAIPKQPLVAACLRELADMENYTTNQVQACLNQ